MFPHKQPTCKKDVSLFKSDGVKKGVQDGSQEIDVMESML